MDRTERTWKIFLDVLLTCGAAVLVPAGVGARRRLAIAWLVAHTMNFFFNSHFWSLSKHFGSVNQEWPSYQSELIRLQQRIADEPGIRFAAAYGSLARGRWNPHSDLDVRLVRAPGVISACRVCWFATYERARAFWRRFPLDLYVLDSYSSLKRLAECAQPILLGGSDASTQSVGSESYGTPHEPAHISPVNVGL